MQSPRPDRPPPDEDRLSSARDDALLDARWQDALDAGRQLLAHMRVRGCSAAELASARLRDCGALLGLGRDSAATALLAEIEAASAGDPDQRTTQAECHAYRALIAAKGGHAAEALAHEREALAIRYAVTDAAAALSHFNIANHLPSQPAAPDLTRSITVHRLAAALIAYRTGLPTLPLIAEGLADHLRSVHSRTSQSGEGERTAASPALPENFDTLCHALSDLEGIDLAAFLSGLPGRGPSGDETFAALFGTSASPRAPVNDALRTAARENAREALCALALAHSHRVPGAQLRAVTAGLRETFARLLPEDLPWLDEQLARLHADPNLDEADRL